MYLPKIVRDPAIKAYRTMIDALVGGSVAGGSAAQMGDITASTGVTIGLRTAALVLVFNFLRNIGEELTPYLGVADPPRKRKHEPKHRAT